MLKLWGRISSINLPKVVLATCRCGTPNIRNCAAGKKGCGNTLRRAVCSTLP